MWFSADHGQLIPVLLAVRHCMLKQKSKGVLLNKGTASIGISVIIHTHGAEHAWFVMSNRHDKHEGACLSMISNKYDMHEGVCFQQAMPFGLLGSSTNDI